MLLPFGICLYAQLQLRLSERAARGIDTARTTDSGHLARRSHTAILSLEDTLIFLVAAAPAGQQYRKHTDRLEGIDRPDEQRVYHLNSLSL